LSFERWMKSTKLSKKSSQHYYRAIKGVLSDWAVEAGLIQGNILGINSRTEFDSISIKIQQLPKFMERNKKGNNMYGSALKKYSEFLSQGAIASVEEDIENIVSDSSIDVTEKAQLISARIGQGQYRKELLSYWGKCAVSGFQNPTMLVASHIKPWSRSTNTERLDKFNGLLLTPNLDRAFDQGLISFSETGSILISPSLIEPEALGIIESMAVRLADEHQSYMEFHRVYVFQNAL
jgi:putative restriction endonuclease